MTRPSAPLDVAQLRADEVRYRARGKFDLALQYQRQADLVESGDDPQDRIYAVFDRGVLGPVVWGSVGHLFAFELPSGLVWCLTADRMTELFGIVCSELGLGAEQLCTIAIAVAKGGAVDEAAPRIAARAWDQGWEANERGDVDNPYEGEVQP